MVSSYNTVEISPHASEDSFYREVARSLKLWTLCDSDGFLAQDNPTGAISIPFWSSLMRVHHIIELVSQYKYLQPIDVNWYDFSNIWIPGLSHDSLLVGINWCGKNATGVDIEPWHVKQNIEHQLTVLINNSIRHR